LALLSEQYKSHVLLIDTFSVINSIIADPAAYGLTNVYLPAQMFPVDPNTSLFWDGVHPTTAGHRVIADQVIEAMLEHYVPGQAIGLDGQKPGWLNR
ncbi:MAG TPA: SGNH/GDSL hydrolase family protein, partial [Oceanipulchritudo sp.]|nr:SGNH/GDSL hydrolase family protein [Oceanipulchritudo sp.]